MTMKKALSTFLLLLALTTLASAQTNEQYLVNSKTLNMRSGPGKEYEIIYSDHETAIWNVWPNRED